MNLPKLTKYETKLISKIIDLKKQKNALILAHNYQKYSIYCIADFIGDSYELSKIASQTNKNTIVFCGVRFMAETAKILSPNKNVLIPDINAGCTLVNVNDIDAILKLKKKYPKAQIVTYVNSSAELKAISDACCTSANAIEVVKSMESDEIIFCPDKNLGRYVQNHTNKKIILLNDFCNVHKQISIKSILAIKKNHPNAKIVAHPECNPDVLDIADKVASTKGMLDYCKEFKNQDFIIATEINMINRLNLVAPNNNYFEVAGVCEGMSKINPENVLMCLNENKYIIDIDKDIMAKAKKALDRMMR